MSEGIEGHLLEKRLEGLRDTQESVQGLSLWCQANKQHSTAIIDTWLRVLRKSPVEKRLTMFYLANDVVQHAKRKGDTTVVNQWAVAVQKATPHVRSPSSVSSAIVRIFKIWEERSVYSKDTVQDLIALVSKHNVTPKEKQPETKKKPEFYTARDEKVKAFSQHLLISTIKLAYRLKSHLGVTFKTKQYVNMNMEQLIGSIKDREHGETVVESMSSLLEACRMSESKLSHEVEERRRIVEAAEIAIVYFENVRSDARIVHTAYKTFTEKVQETRMRCDEMIRAFAEMEGSPVPSPVSSPGGLKNIVPPLAELQAQATDYQNTQEQLKEKGVSMMESGSEGYELSTSSSAWSSDSYNSMMNNVMLMQRQLSSSYNTYSSPTPTPNTTTTVTTDLNSIPLPPDLTSTSSTTNAPQTNNGGYDLLSNYGYVPMGLTPSPYVASNTNPNLGELQNYEKSEGFSSSGYETPNSSNSRGSSEYSYVTPPSTYGASSTPSKEYSNYSNTTPTTAPTPTKNQTDDFSKYKPFDSKPSVEDDYSSYGSKSRPNYPSTSYPIPQTSPSTHPPYVPPSSYPSSTADSSSYDNDSFYEESEEEYYNSPPSSRYHPYAPPTTNNLGGRFKHPGAPPGISYSPKNANLTPVLVSGRGRGSYRGRGGENVTSNLLRLANLTGGDGAEESQIEENGGGGSESFATPPPRGMPRGRFVRPLRGGRGGGPSPRPLIPNLGRGKGMRVPGSPNIRPSFIPSGLNNHLQRFRPGMRPPRRGLY